MEKVINVFRGKEEGSTVDDSGKRIKKQADGWVWVTTFIPQRLTATSSVTSITLPLELTITFKILECIAF